MNSLTQELEKINQTHEATVRLIQETPGIPGSLMKEYVYWSSFFVTHCSKKYLAIPRFHWC